MPHTPPDNTDAAAQGSPLDRLLAAISIRPGEGRITLFSALTIFTFFLGYGMIRPLRDAMGVERGFDDLPWLITATMLVSLAVSPVVAWTMARLGTTPEKRRRLLGYVFRFFALNLLVFALVKWLTPEAHRFRVGYTFYVWASVFNMTCVSAFWGLMADLHPRERSLRIYGLIGFGATLGLLLGATAAKELAKASVSPIAFVLALAVLLEVAAQFASVAIRQSGLSVSLSDKPSPTNHAPPVRSDSASSTTGPFSGILAVLRSPYLLAVCAYLLIYTITSTLFYLTQQRVVLAAGVDTSARTALNATIDQWVNGATLIVQLLLTGRIIRLIGQGGALATTPLVTIAGLLFMGQTPGLSTLIPAVVTRKSIHYAVDRPGREALYTVIPPEQKYTAKSFIDTFIYRGGDVLGTWTETALKSSNTPLLWFAGPLCLVAVGLGWWLGATAKRTGDQSKAAATTE